jgi:hypothetical protein
VGPAHLPRPDISGVQQPDISAKTTIARGGGRSANSVGHFTVIFRKGQKKGGKGKKSNKKKKKSKVRTGGGKLFRVDFHVPPLPNPASGRGLLVRSGEGGERFLVEAKNGERWLVSTAVKEHLGLVSRSGGTVTPSHQDTAGGVALDAARLEQAQLENYIGADMKQHLGWGGQLAQVDTGGCRETQDNAVAHFLCQAPVAHDDYREAKEDYIEASPSANTAPGITEEGNSGLKNMDYQNFADLHEETKDHWGRQHVKNEDDLNKILKSDDDVLIHEHSIQRKPTNGRPETYPNRTIEVCVITDPYLFDMIKKRFDLTTDKEVNMKIFKTVHKTLLSAETFLKHRSISRTGGGFRLKLNGIRVLKDWGHLAKMKSRKNLQDVLFDLGDYMQVLCLQTLELLLVFR